MDQGFLFDTEQDIKADPARELSRRSDPATSKEAAQKQVDRGKVNVNQGLCLRALADHPCSTYAEIAQLTGLDLPEPARRLPDLRRKGLVRVVGMKECPVRKSKCQTWMLTAEGLKWLQGHG